MKASSGFNRVPVVRVGDNIDGRYHVLAMIADGGMGTVFLAEHMLIKRRVAVKVLHRELAGDHEMIERFMNEASAASKLGHPNIVESTDMGFTRDHIPYIVFEYLEGALLTEEIYRIGGLPVRRALRIAKQIASALEAAHAANIVHLDLKSDNIFLVDKDGTTDHAKVLDFGIARFTESERAITQREVVMGTPEFMSPEQVTTPDEVDARSDIYALGVVLYEMLAARRPFAGDDPRVLLHRIVYELPPRLAAGSVPPELETILLDKLLAKNPDDRFRSMHEVGAALDTILRDLRTADSIPPPLRASPEPEPPRPAPVALPAVVVGKRWSMPLLALALLSAAGAAVLGYVGHRFSDEAHDSSAHGLENDAAELANLVDSSQRSAQLRAETLASSPVLRAAMETDAATIRDLVVNEHLFT
ncbi:MAG TPA: serine/threonine-protein kinase, partial [Kofleriaceae bacterium]